jgi:4,5-DOPA dioxygenase extradiol
MLPVRISWLTADIICGDCRMIESNKGTTFTMPTTPPPVMPVLFLGHGSPMNAIEENEFVDAFRAIGREIPKPSAILCISAHWETNGTFVTAMDKPRTIHDFGGFPEKLYAVQYPAPGNPLLARQIATMTIGTSVGLDESWGLDHGCWTVVRHLYPEADLPVVQLSLDRTKPARFHYQLAQELAPLRRQGILIIGSGNIVHNLGRVVWDKLNSIGYGHEWALDAQGITNKLILDNNHDELIEYQKLGQAVSLAVPTPEHYLPLLYVLALKEEGDRVSLFNDKAVAGSLTMTSVKFTEPVLNPNCSDK